MQLIDRVAVMLFPYSKRILNSDKVFPCSSSLHSANSTFHSSSEGELLFIACPHDFHCVVSGLNRRTSVPKITNFPAHSSGDHAPPWPKIYGLFKPSVSIVPVYFTMHQSLPVCRFAGSVQPLLCRTPNATTAPHSLH